MAKISPPLLPKPLQTGSVKPELSYIPHNYVTLQQLQERRLKEQQEEETRTAKNEEEHKRQLELEKSLQSLAVEESGLTFRPLDRNLQGQVAAERIEVQAVERDVVRHGMSVVGSMAGFHPPIPPKSSQTASSAKPKLSKFPCNYITLQQLQEMRLKEHQEKKSKEEEERKRQLDLEKSLQNLPVEDSGCSIQGNGKSESQASDGELVRQETNFGGLRLKKKKAWRRKKEKPIDRNSPNSADAVCSLVDNLVGAEVLKPKLEKTRWNDESGVRNIQHEPNVMIIRKMELPKTGKEVDESMAGMNKFKCERLGGRFGSSVKFIPKKTMLNDKEDRMMERGEQVSHNLSEGMHAEKEAGKKDDKRNSRKNRRLKKGRMDGVLGIPKNEKIEEAKDQKEENGNKLLSRRSEQKISTDGGEEYKINDMKSTTVIAELAWEIGIENCDEVVKEKFRERSLVRNQPVHRRWGGRQSYSPSWSGREFGQSQRQFGYGGRRIPEQFMWVRVEEKSR